MRILGIETSCDDTGIAVLEVSGKKNPRFALLSNVVASQIRVHQKYGGVYPTLAKREHQKNLPLVLSSALKKAKLSQKNPSIDAIAATFGPGLSPCLWTGLNFAKELARKWNVPLVPVNHIAGHLLVSVLMPEDEQNPHMRNLFTQETFPAVALIVSGGHTQLILVKEIGKYKILGETRDDAAGECFDKTARILGLPYPGGPAIAAEAAQWKPQIPMPNAQSNPKFQLSITLPRPMLHTKDYDLSFSGLKTAVLYDYQSRAEKVRKSKAYIRAMAAEIQQAIIDVLLHKTLRAAKEYNAKSIILGGGVAANIELRTAIKKECTRFGLIHLIPPPNLATDNGAMIALAGYFNFQAGKAIKNWDRLEANPNLRIA